jgi:hypothetical protein
VPVRALPFHRSSCTRASLAALLLAAALLPARAADAQILSLPRRSREPQVWVQGGVGLLQLGVVQDGRTGTNWEFSQGAQYRASLEYDLGRLGRGLAAGLTVGYAPNVALVYVDEASDRDAHAAVTSVMGLFRVGGGQGLHQVIEIQGGIVRFGDFRDDDAGDAALPPESDSDFIFGLGYGFGLSLNERLQIALVQDVMQSFHQREGLGNGARTNTTHYSTRLQLRYGLGSKPAVR